MCLMLYVHKHTNFIAMLGCYTMGHYFHGGDAIRRFIDVFEFDDFSADNTRIRHMLIRMASSPEAARATIADATRAHSGRFARHSAPLMPLDMQASSFY